MRFEFRHAQEVDVNRFTVVLIAYIDHSVHKGLQA